MRSTLDPELPFEAQPSPPLRPNGQRRRWFDRALRGALGLGLALAVWRHGFGADPHALAFVGVATALLCAFAHAAPRAPRAASAVSFALAVGALVAVGFTALFALIATFSALRLYLHSGDAGAWLLEVHRVERRRRGALVATGFALGHGSLRTLAGDLYEQAGWARRELVGLGAHPSAARLCRPLGRGVALTLCAVPVVGSIAKRAIASRLREFAAELARSRAEPEA